MVEQNRIANATLAEALETARDAVRQRWPEFANIDPQISERITHPLHPADAGRLGVACPAARAAADAEYTFIFSHEVRTAEGYTIPRVARITVDTHQHVVKAVISK